MLDRRLLGSPAQESYDLAYCQKARGQGERKEEINHPVGDQRARDCGRRDGRGQSTKHNSLEDSQSSGKLRHEGGNLTQNEDSEKAGERNCLSVRKEDEQSRTREDLVGKAHEGSKDHPAPGQGTSQVL
jgi:hypothetical protein